ncbi:hypothetical protein ON010_g18409 [Phytophthora cinnamomi]|nr:hypothetical protein ON010_g18409 [Phytophthora cinnamomi]
MVEPSQPRTIPEVLLPPPQAVRTPYPATTSALGTRTRRSAARARSRPTDTAPRWPGVTTTSWTSAAQAAAAPPTATTTRRPTRRTVKPPTRRARTAASRVLPATRRPTASAATAASAWRLPVRGLGGDGAGREVLGLHVRHELEPVRVRVPVEDLLRLPRAGGGGGAGRDTRHLARAAVGSDPQARGRALPAVRDAALHAGAGAAGLEGAARGAHRQQGGPRGRGPRPAQADGKLKLKCTCHSGEGHASVSVVLAWFQYWWERNHDRQKKGQKGP